MARTVAAHISKSTSKPHPVCEHEHLAARRARSWWHWLQLGYRDPCFDTCSVWRSRTVCSGSTSEPYASRSTWRGRREERWCGPSRRWNRPIARRSGDKLNSCTWWACAALEAPERERHHNDMSRWPSIQHLLWRLTSALSGPREAVAARRRRKISSRACGAPPATCHGPLQRIVRFHSLPRGIGALARRSAMRVCQPGPVARQRFTTSGGRRREMSWRGFAERGRPPLLTTARRNISSVSSGSSLYSERRIRCASTRLRSDRKVRREAVLLTSIGLSHAEDVAIRATRGVADDDQASLELAVAEHPSLAIVLARVLDLDGQTCEHDRGILKIQTSFRHRPGTLVRIVGNAHRLVYIQ